MTEELWMMVIDIIASVVFVGMGVVIGWASNIGLSSGNDGDDE